MRQNAESRVKFVAFEESFHTHRCLKHNGAESFQLPDSDVSLKSLSSDLLTAFIFLSLFWKTSRPITCCDYSLYQTQSEWSPLCTARAHIVMWYSSITNSKILSVSRCETYCQRRPQRLLQKLKCLVKVHSSRLRRTMGFTCAVGLSFFFLLACISSSLYSVG